MLQLVFSLMLFAQGPALVPADGPALSQPKNTETAEGDNSEEISASDESSEESTESSAAPSFLSSRSFSNLGYLVASVPLHLRHQRHDPSADRGAWQFPWRARHAGCHLGYHVPPRHDLAQARALWPC